MYFEPITKDEARGRSKPKPLTFLIERAKDGRRAIDLQQSDYVPVPDAEMVHTWPELRVRALHATRDSWGGITIDTRDNTIVHRRAGYAVAARLPGQSQLSIPLGLSPAEFDVRLAQHVRELGPSPRYIGIFRDDDNARIDVDPVYLTDDLETAISVGIFSHATGGIYDFSTGDAVWLPHLAS